MKTTSFATIFLLMCLGCAGGGGAPQVERGPISTWSNEEKLEEFTKETQPGELIDEYIIGVGDILDVVFFFHDDLTTQDLEVRRDGRITLPYVGDVMAAGRTPMQLDSTLTASFSEILRDPNLSVIVRSTPDKHVYVVGHVPRPGGYPFDYNISLIEALSLGGGLIPGSKSDQVLVIRRQGLDEITAVEVNVKSILDGGAVEQDFLLRDHDIVYIPKTRIHKVGDFVQELHRISGPPVDALLRAGQIVVFINQLELMRKQIDTIE